MSARQILCQLLLVKATLAFMLDIHRQHIGCFKDDPLNRDLPHLAENPEAQGSLENCVKACSELHYMYSAVQNGDQCYCGSSYGLHGPADSGQCTMECTKDPNERCGGENANTIYETGMQEPGPPENLELISAGTTNLSITWGAPIGAPSQFVTGYKVFATLSKSFDVKNTQSSPKEISISAGNTTTIIGLQPGTAYNVSVAAKSEKGFGTPLYELFWTEIGDPTPPETPKLVRHEDDEEHTEDHPGEIHIKFSPPKRNENGPISAFRVVVINETEPAPFDKESLYDWSRAQEEDLKYWIAAEIDPEFFDNHDEFVVGDGREYKGYLNYGPLPKEQDFHVTVGTVSTWNNVTKVSYASVSHDQHDHENMIVFKFHDHSKDHHHDAGHSHEVRILGGTRLSSDGVSTTLAEGGGPDSLAIGLTVAIVVFSILLAGVVGFYAFLRCRLLRRRGGGGGNSRRSNGDVQELTAHMPASSDLEALEYENDGMEEETRDPRLMDGIRSRVWQIPRNFLELTHEVIGRGKFGSVIKGRVNKRGTEDAAIVQVVPGKIMDDFEMRMMVNDIELVVRGGTHPNILQLIGICEEMESIFVVLEEGIKTLKQVLLDSRALIHYPLYAEKHQTVSSLSEETVLEHLVGIARGMEHLAANKIYHRKLCARNIFCVGDVAKIAGLGIMEYSTPGQELDGVRWTAQEAFKSRSYGTKCDVWSFGCLMWEALTLGATPYVAVKSKDVATRVARGLRLPLIKNVSDELYQLMLECWQHDLDERPTFETVANHLAEMASQGAKNYLNFAAQQDFEYESFVNELEVL